MAGSWEIREQRKVFCAILTREQVTMAWALAFKNLIIPGQAGVLTGMPFDMARNTACQQALDGGFEYLFFLDDDCCPPPDAILRLLSHNVPIVSGVYYRRSNPIGFPVMLRNVPGGRKYVTEYKIPDLIEVDYVGAGCLLIHRSVLEQMPPQQRPCPNCKTTFDSEHRWFDWRVDWLDRDTDGLNRLSEDYQWNEWARKNGFKIMVDTSIQCRHIGLAEARLHREGDKVQPIYVPAEMRVMG